MGKTDAEGGIGSPRSGTQREAGAKPRLLIVAHAFPPRNVIGGVRAYHMAKWLTRKGWEVTVVTPYESLWGRAEGADQFHTDLSRQRIRCIQTPHHWRWLLPLERKQRRHFVGWAIGGVGRRLAARLGIEAESGWIRGAEKACVGLVPGAVDLILASGPPFVSFGIARRLAERLGCPYVLDYRDLWTLNPHAKRVSRNWVIKKERVVLADSAATIGVSPRLAQSLQQQFLMVQAPYVISNGFDPEELEQVPRHDFGHFAIVYAGVFYPPKRAVEPLMAALQRRDALDGVGKDWAFHYYGPQGDYVRRAAVEFKLEHRIVIHGSVPRRDALAAIRGANVAVVISSVYDDGSLQDKGIVTGKVFDAIGLGTVLLVIAPEESDLGEILSAAGLGERCAGSEIDRMSEFLEDVMNGRVPPAVTPETFSWQRIVERLDGTLRKVLIDHALLRGKDWRRRAIVSQHVVHG